MDFDKYINKHLGERCFILGSSPSINDENLSLIEYEKIFISNKFFLFTKQLGLTKYDYYAVTDPYSYKNLYENYLSELEKISVPILTTNTVVDLNKIDQLDNYFIAKKNAEIFLDNNNFPKTFHSEWPRTGSVVFDQTILAFFMGFKEIYLLGVDFSYFDTQEMTHFYGTGKFEQKQKKKAKLDDKSSQESIIIKNSMKTLSDYLNSHGVVYKNLSKKFKFHDLMEADALENVMRSGKY